MQRKTMFYQRFSQLSHFLFTVKFYFSFSYFLSTWRSAVLRVAFELCVYKAKRNMCCYNIYICIRIKQNNYVNDSYIILNCTLLHSMHVKVLLKYISCLMFLEFQKHNNYVSIKVTLDVMGLKITTLSQEPVNHSHLLN